MQTQHHGLRGWWGRYGLPGICGLFMLLGVMVPLSASGISGQYTPAPVLSPDHAEIGLSSPFLWMSSKGYDIAFFPEVFVRMGLQNRWEFHAQALPFWSPVVDVGAGFRYMLIAPSTPEGWALTAGLEYEYVYATLLVAQAYVHNLHPSIWIGTRRRYMGLWYSASFGRIQSISATMEAQWMGAVTLCIGEIREKPGTRLYTEMDLRLFPGMPLRDAWAILVGIGIGKSYAWSP